MKIFKKKNYGVINISSIDNKYIPIVPDGAWVKCDYCGKILYKKYLEIILFVIIAVVILDYLLMIDYDLLVMKDHL